jgi:hypothetical protein
MNQIQVASVFRRGARTVLTHDRDRKLLETVSDTGTVSDTS